MKSISMILVFALAAIAGVFSFNWGALEGDFSTLEIQAKGAVLAVVEQDEDGNFPDSTEVIEAYYVIPEGCISCQICVGQCPVEAITMDENDLAVIDPALCINCGICAEGCPTGTIELLEKNNCGLYGVDGDGNKELLMETFGEE